MRGARNAGSGSRGRAATRLATLGAVVLASVGVGAVGQGLVPGTASASTPQPQYYLALGDSLAAGTGASSTATRYVNVLYQHELAHDPGLQLDNLACGGATTTSVIDGPGCSYASGTQLGDAEAFLRAHPGQVPFVTIDIGANDVDGCLSGSTVNVSCVQSGLSHITANLPQILDGLEAAYPGLAIYGMNYYDPFLGLWVTGATGQTLAQQSEALAVTLNTQLASEYAAAGAGTADVATPFQTTDFDVTGTYLGAPEPQNVADICNWTLFCSGGGNIHANDTGHALVAGAFEQVLDSLAIVAPTLPDAVPGAPYGPVQLTASGVGVSTSPNVTTLRWKKVSLPKGLHLSYAGVLSGSPSKRSTAGPTSVTVQVTENVTTLNGNRKVHTKTAVQATFPLTIA